MLDGRLECLTAEETVGDSRSGGWELKKNMSHHRVRP